MTPPKLLFFLQISLPFVLVPFISRRNLLLFGYGFFVTLLADREPLFQISFQYVWYILPFMFMALIYSLNPVKAGFSRLLWAIVVLSFFVSWQYGALFDRRDFRGGFATIDFHYTPEEHAKRNHLHSLIQLIPPTASVTTSETICPHLYDFSEVQTFRYFRDKTDYLLLFLPNFENVPLYQNLMQNKDYLSLREENGFQLLIRNPEKL